MTALLDLLYREGCKRPRCRAAASRLHNALAGNRFRIAGVGNSFDCVGAFVRRVTVDVRGSGSLVRFAPMAMIENMKIHLEGAGHRLTIGSECRIKSGTIHFADESCTIDIGAETTIEDAHIAVTEPGGSVTIGRDCMIAFDVDIRNGDSHAICDTATGDRINYAEDIRIGDHVWLGAHVQVLKGVMVGDNAVVGVRSVVTRDIPGGSIACGAPAEVVRESISWDRRR